MRSHLRSNQTVRYHTHTTIVVTGKRKNNKCCKDVTLERALFLIGGNEKMVYTIMENNMGSPYKLLR